MTLDTLIERRTRHAAPHVRRRARRPGPPGGRVDQRHAHRNARPAPTTLARKRNSARGSAATSTAVAPGPTTGSCCSNPSCISATMSWCRILPAGGGRRFPPSTAPTTAFISVPPDCGVKSSAHAPSVSTRLEGRRLRAAVLHRIRSHARSKCCVSPRGAGCRLAVVSEDDDVRAEPFHDAEFELDLKTLGLETRPWLAEMRRVEEVRPSFPLRFGAQAHNCDESGWGG
jgi:hypothetical protein